MLIFCFLIEILDLGYLKHVVEDDSIFKLPTSQPLKGADNYELATHAVKVRRTGMLSDVKAIWDLSGKVKYYSSKPRY